MARREGVMKSPFEKFLADALEGFERHLEDEKLAPRAREFRMRGAEQFALFLLGKPAQKHGRSKGAVRGA
jgi:hypothetical protein